MYITRRQYDAAVTASGTDPAVAAALWARLKADRENRPHFNVYHIAYYAGAMIAIAAMAILLGNFWHELSGLQISLVALIFGGFFSAIGAYFWRLGPHARIPAGLFITMAASLTPLFVFGVQRDIGLPLADFAGQYHTLPEWLREGWFAMEAATLLIAGLLLHRLKIPLLTVLIAVTLWLVAMDLTAIAFGEETTRDDHRLVSVIFGAGLLICAYATDLSPRRDDFAFWLYLLWLLAFSGGLTVLDSDSEWAKLAYCLTHLALIALAAFLRRIMFIAFGAFGIGVYLVHLARKVFRDELLFPLALAVLGAAIIAGALFAYRRRALLAAWVDRQLPEILKRFRPPA